MKYSDQLKDKRWLQKRQEIIDRDKCCQKCGAVDKFEVHHLRYIRGYKAWEYENEDLILLCHYCHDKETKEIKYLRELINEMLLSGFYAEEISAQLTYLRM